MIKIKKNKSADAHEQQTPYAGTFKGTVVPTAPHLLVSGPTGRGKSLRVLVPGALMWRGPRVLVSSKTDFMKEVMKRNIHERGPVYVMDLAGEIDDSFTWLKGVEYTRVAPDPTTLIDNDDDALDMASLLMKVGAIGAAEGGNSSGSGDAFWETLAAQPLAALLLAAKASGDGVTWALRAVGKVKKDDADDISPSWANAYELVEKTSFHAGELLSAGRMEDKIRDSIMATMKSGLKPWVLTNVRGTDGVEPFWPKMLEGPAEPTLVIISPSDSLAPGAAVACVETIIRHWRRGVERGLPRVLLSIDEAVNTCYLPRLPVYVTEARGLGVACVIAVQSTTQMKSRWGEVGAEILREVFPAFLVLEGAPEFDALDLASKWSGEHDVWRETINPDNSKTLTAEKAPRRTVSELLPETVEKGRLLLYGKEGHKVDLPGIWQFG